MCSAPKAPPPAPPPPSTPAEGVTQSGTPASQQPTPAANAPDAGAVESQKNVELPEGTKAQASDLAVKKSFQTSPIVAPLLGSGLNIPVGL